MTGSLEGTVKRRGSLPTSLQSEIETAIDLCTQGLNERFGILINASPTNKSKKQAAYGSQEVVNDMLVLNVDVWPSNPSHLVDYGTEEIQRLIEWFRPLLHTAGCNIDAVQDQWVSEIFGKEPVSEDGQHQRLGNITNQGSLQRKLQRRSSYRGNCPCPTYISCSM